MNSDIFKLLCPYQIRWMEDQSPLAIAQKSRRIGWTWTEALRAVLDTVEGDKGDYWISSVDATATEEFIGYCEEWAAMVKAVAVKTDQEEFIRDPDTGDMVAVTRKVLTFANGKRISAGSSNPRFFRSKGGRAAWDEAAFHDQGREMFKAAHATAMFWGYPLHIWSTHNGEDAYFNFLLNEAVAGRLKASVHTVTINDAVEQGIVERIIMRKKKLSEPPPPDEGARKAWLQEMRDTCPDQETWDEEYMCLPSSAGRQFLHADLIRSCEEPNLKILDVLDDEFDKLEGPLYGGVDIGRSHDLTVLDFGQTVGDVLWERGLLELHNMKFSAQKAIFRRFLRHPKVQRIAIDKMGIGFNLWEDLVEEFGAHRVEGYNTDAVEGAFALRLREGFEDRTIRIGALEKRREALRKPKKIVVGKNIRFQKPRDKDGHCDQFVALYLLYAAADITKAPLPAPQLLKPVGW